MFHIFLPLIFLIKLISKQIKDFVVYITMNQFHNTKVLLNHQFAKSSIENMGCMVQLKIENMRSSR